MVSTYKLRSRRAKRGIYFDGKMTTENAILYLVHLSFETRASSLDRSSGDYDTFKKVRPTGGSTPVRTVVYGIIFYAQFTRAFTFLFHWRRSSFFRPAAYTIRVSFRLVGRRWREIRVNLEFLSQDATFRPWTTKLLDREGAGGARKGGTGLVLTSDVLRAGEEEGRWRCWYSYSNDG